jgi:UDP-glucose:glycoprotein glucosyltransferase
MKKVRKKPGKEMEDLLSEAMLDEQGAKGSFWHQWMPWGSEATNATKINVFSVASGHLYERFLRIMIASVLKHTKSPVKFWFIENFLSPSFKVSIVCGVTGD